MKVLSNEGAPHGILVNGMLVGLIDFDQHVRRHAARRLQHHLRGVPRRDGRQACRWAGSARPEEFAAMACFLCSDLAGFTTGTAINMDGGASPVV